MPAGIAMARRGTLSRRGAPSTNTNLPYTTNLVYHWDSKTLVYSDAGATLAVNNDPVYRVIDRAVNPINFDQATLGLRPIYHASGGPGNIPWIEWDGSDDRLTAALAGSKIGTTFLSEVWTMFMVFKIDAGTPLSGTETIPATLDIETVSGTRKVRSYANESAGYSGDNITAIPLSTWVLLTLKNGLTVQSGNPALQFRVNGVHDGYGGQRQCLSPANTSWNIGYQASISPAAFDGGRVFEALYSEQMSDANVTLVENAIIAEFLNSEARVSGLQAEVMVLPDVEARVSGLQVEVMVLP